MPPNGFFRLPRNGALHAARAAEVVGLGSAVWSLAQPIGAVIAGVLIDSLGTYRVSLVGAAVFVLIGFVLMLTVHPERAVLAQRQATPV